MAKRGSKSTKLLTGAKTGSKGQESKASVDQGSSGAAGPSKISDALRQAVKDLGGDDEDLELIQGVEDDGEDIDFTPQAKGKESASDEVRVALDDCISAHMNRNLSRKRWASS